jgi:hypothetical protein
VDTVEWGSAGPARRRLRSLRFRVPRVGAPGLAVVGFLALVVAELLPWGIVHLPPGVGAAAAIRSTRLPLTEGQGLSLDHFQSVDLIAYHLGALALLGAIGTGLAGTPGRRRAAMGAALGLAAGMVIPIVSLFHTVFRYFDDYGGGYPTFTTGTDVVSAPTTSVGSGAYVALVAVGLLAASALTSGLVRRRSVAPSPRAEEGPAPGDEREFEVSALEPFDEAYFARRDGR